VQPAASASAIFHVAISSGKFHETIWPTTPTGSYGEGQIFARKGERDRRASDFGRPAAHVVEHIDRQRQIRDPRHGIGLAVVDRLEFG
jgi:hypothetical protein